MRAPLRLSFAALLLGCGLPSPSAPEPRAAVDGGAKDGVTSSERFTFAEDLAFLDAHGETIVLSGEGAGRVVVSPRFQGRVMTSSTGPSGPSFGWINRSFIESGKTGTPFDNYGGEDRFWLGPEGGQYGLYFPPKGPFAFDAWQTPHALQEGAWDVTLRASDHVVLKRSMRVTNWSGTEFAVDVERTVRVLGLDDVYRLLGGDFRKEPSFPNQVRFVGFETTNRIVNAGKARWTKDTGLVSVWILSMFAPSSDARVFIPFEKDAPTGTRIVNDLYFGKVPAERLSVNEDEGYLSFRCDGKERGKIGLGPSRAKNLLGSYSRAANLLTVVHYDGPKKGAPYVNSMWANQSEPYAGDVVNSYNDGPPAPGKPPLGGFYEIETSSPGAELAPGEALVHAQRTFHFHGPPHYVERLGARVLLGRAHLPD